MIITATDLWRMSATELAEAIRSRHISSQEVIEAHLRRIEAVNPSVNAVTVVLDEQALEAAQAADRTVAAGSVLSRFHGVPFTIKGNIDLAGTPTTQGLKALVGAYPKQDAMKFDWTLQPGACRAIAFISPSGRQTSTNTPNDGKPAHGKALYGKPGTWNA